MPTLQNLPERFDLLCFRVQGRGAWFFAFAQNTTAVSSSCCFTAPTDKIKMSSEVPEQPPLMGILRIPAQFGNEERTFPVVLGSNIIGKNKGSIMLNDDFVSSLHANIRK